MKAYLTSIGEKTTDLCKWQLERLGFEVILLDKKEDWPTKYKRFIDMANENCIRIDADVILFNDFTFSDGVDFPFMATWKVVDFYKLKLHQGQPVFYSKPLLEVAKKIPVSSFRPETSLWRHPQIIGWTENFDVVAGLHGFWQRDEDIARTKEANRLRGHGFDEEFVKRVRGL